MSLPLRLLNKQTLREKLPSWWCHRSLHRRKQPEHFLLYTSLLACPSEQAIHLEILPAHIPALVGKCSRNTEQNLSEIFLQSDGSLLRKCVWILQSPSRTASARVPWNCLAASEIICCPLESSVTVLVYKVSKEMEWRHCPLRNQRRARWKLRVVWTSLVVRLEILYRPHTTSIMVKSQGALFMCPTAPKIKGDISAWQCPW
jgi:hypothetical protein